MWEYESRAQCGRPEPHTWNRSPQLPPESAGEGEGMFGTQSWAVGQSGRLEEGNSLFPSHKTAEIFRIPELHMAVTMIL